MTHLMVQTVYYRFLPTIFETYGMHTYIHGVS